VDLAHAIDDWLCRHFGLSQMVVCHRLASLAFVCIASHRIAPPRFASPRFALLCWLFFVLICWLLFVFFWVVVG